MKFIFIALSVFFAGCQTMPPRFVQREQKNISIQGTTFLWVSGEDEGADHWQQVGIRPLKLPYSGALAKLDAQKRWMILFDQAAKSVKEYCGQRSVELGEIVAEKLDYSQFGNQLEHPAFIQMGFRCP